MVLDFSHPIDESRISDSSKSETSRINSVRQLLDVEILYLLNCEPCSGYELKKQLASVFELNLSYGTLYPHLRSLKEYGLIFGNSPDATSSPGPRSAKTTYALTFSGSVALRDAVQSLTRIGLTMHFTLNKFDLRAGEAAGSKERESTLKAMQAILARRGYSTMRDVKMKGVSGVEHRFEVLATSTGKKREMIIVHVLDQRSGAAFGLDRAMKLLVVAQDVRGRVLVLAVPGLDAEVRDFFTFHGITFFDGGDWQSILAEMLLRFNRKLE